MDFDFDPDKDATDRAKHGLSLILGAAVINNCIGQLEDNRRDYGEVRINAFGLVNERLLVCTYTLRGTTYRVISVRRASRQERRKWLG